MRVFRFIVRYCICFSLIFILFAEVSISQEYAEDFIQLKNQPKFLKNELPSDLDLSIRKNKSVLEKSRGFLFWEDKNLSTYGIWVEAEGQSQPLNDPLELDKLLKIISKYPISDLYVQVYRNGRSWFSSEYADDTPYREIKQKGRDPLAEIINAARKKENKVNVHVWFNALRLGDDPKAKVFNMIGADSSLVSSRGESLYATKGQGARGCRPDAPGIWLDSNNEKVFLLLIKVFSEVASQYPSIDGLHLDMIRRPFPYSQVEKKSLDCTGFFPPFEEEEKNLISESDKNEIFKKTGTTRFVRKVKKVLDTMFPKLTFSTAVLSHQKTAISSAGQPWPLWIENRYVDYVVTMNYTDNQERFEKEVFDAISLGEDRISIGVGAWLAKNNPKLLEKQVKFVKDKNLKGVVLFSHGNLAEDGNEELYKSVTSVLGNKF